ncbi:MAG: DUF1800 domain-containing protein [Phycisphaeraceae bacterium]|nr:DUF1800 domain-containing protein [Phycisphaeraceae bacterium]
MPTQPEAPTKAEPGRSGRTTASMTPIKAASFGYNQARHLLWRAGFGGTPNQIQTLLSWGPERSVDYLLDTDKAPFEAVRADQFDRNIIRPPTPDEQAEIRRARQSQNQEALARIQVMQQERENRDRLQAREMQKWWLGRMIETPRPLEEKMTLFWHGHFATAFRGVENSYHMFMQNMMFRANAVGSFADLLHGIIRDPAMLRFLNNNESRRNRPNENLAREIMELFSLGIGNYTERDIKEGARALTGYTFTDDEFTFQRNNHDNGGKTILGVSGNLDGDGFVKAILAQKACARFVARKLYAFFVADIPPLEATDNDRTLDPVARSAIADLASVLRSSDYALRPTLRRMFLSEHFYDDRIRNQQIKSPVQLVVGAMRSLNTPVRSLSALNDACDLMGQNLFMPPSVKGWDGGRSWINTGTLYVRQNILAFLLTGKRAQGYDPLAKTDERYDPMPLLSELAKASPGAEKDPAKVAEYLLKLTLGSAPESARSILSDFARSLNTGVTPDLVTGMLLLITAMPEYQLC